MYANRLFPSLFSLQSNKKHIGNTLLSIQVTDTGRGRCDPAWKCQTSCRKLTLQRDRAKALHIAEYQLLVPENNETIRKSSLKSLISLQHNIINTINIQFDEAKDTGNFS